MFQPTNLFKSDLSNSNFYLMTTAVNSPVPAMDAVVAAYQADITLKSLQIAMLSAIIFNNGYISDFQKTIANNVITTGKTGVVIGDTAILCTSKSDLEKLGYEFVDENQQWAAYVELPVVKYNEFSGKVTVRGANGINKTFDLRLDYNENEAIAIQPLGTCPPIVDETPVEATESI